MFKKQDLRFAIEDARVRHAALLELLYEIDRKALALLQLSITLALAFASIFVTGLQFPEFLAREFLLGSLATSIGFWFAAYLCTRVFDPENIAFPGQGSEFWLWAANRKKANFLEVANEYLKRSEKAHLMNRDVNEKTVVKFRRAKNMFIGSPLIGLITVVISALSFYWLPRFSSLTGL